MDERRKRGLCYNCDEKWGVGHNYKNDKLFLLEGIELAGGVQSGVEITELEEEVESKAISNVDNRKKRWKSHCMHSQELLHLVLRG